MEPFIPLIIFSSIAVVGFISYYFSKKMKIIRELKKSNKIDIKNFEHNTVGKIVGQATLLEDTLHAPISNRKCFYYQVIVEEERKSKNSKSWHPIFQDERVVDFLIKDKTGVAQVNFIHKEYIKGYLIKDIKYEIGSFRNNNPRLEKYIQSKGHSTKNFWGSNKKMRYKEGVIHVGETIAVKGRGRWELIPNPEEQKLIIEGVSDIELIISDDKTTLK